MKKSICIELLGTDVDFYDRIPLVKKSGFDYAEFWGWEDKNLERIAELCQTHGVSITSISGDGPYSLCDDNQRTAYIEYAERSMLAAKKIGDSVCVIHSNALGEQGVVLNSYRDYSRQKLFLNMQKTLAELAPIAQRHDILLVLEALNTRYDHPGNALYTTAEGAELIKSVNSPNLRLLYDVYHMQIMEGDLINTIETYLPEIGHIHIADVPGRHEPGTGEINYPAVWEKLKSLQYNGAVGFELSAKYDYDTAVRAIHAL